MIELGVSPIEIASGDGPDIILQRVGMQTHVAAMSETLGIERCREPFPDFEQAMRGVQKASLWSKFSSEKEVLSHLKEYDTFSDRPKPERVQEPRRAVEFVVKKPKLGDDRWDFMS